MHLLESGAFHVRELAGLQPIERKKVLMASNVALPVGVPTRAVKEGVEGDISGAKGLLQTQDNIAESSHG